MKREQLNEMKEATKYLQHWNQNRLSINLINNDTKTIQERSEGTMIDLNDLLEYLCEMTDKQLEKYDIHIEIIERNLAD